MRQARRVWLALLAAVLCGGAQAGTVLEAVKARDKLLCGVSEGIPGWSAPDKEGNWRGFDVDFCRAVAAAVLGDATKIEFVPLTSSNRFPALRMGAVDVLARNTTWTLTRETLLKVTFAGVLFYDGQAFMVPAASGITKLDALAGATVCIENGTRHADGLVTYFKSRGATVTPLVLKTAPEAAAALYTGRCQAYTSDSAQLYAFRAGAPGGPEAFRILPERISKEPLGPAVSALDQEWLQLVRWILFTLIAAEERGYTQAHVAETLDEQLTLGLGVMSRHERALIEDEIGLVRDGLVKAVQAVGNYAEIYDRNLGRDSPFKIERGPNRLWKDGGLLYSPPLN